MNGINPDKFVPKCLIFKDSSFFPFHVLSPNFLTRGSIIFVRGLSRDAICSLHNGFITVWVLLRNKTIYQKERAVKICKIMFTTKRLYGCSNRVSLTKPIINGKNQEKILHKNAISLWNWDMDFQSTCKVLSLNMECHY